jgi:hypothetical protein
LLLFSVPLFFVSLPWLGLLNDDWFRYATAANDWQRLFTGSTTWQRPLEGVAWLAAHRLFGTYIPGFYALLFLVQLLSSGILFLTLGKTFGDRWGFAFATSALFLVFPTDQSKFWLSTFAYRFGTLFIILSTFFGMPSRSEKGWLSSGLSILCYGLAILNNELFLPLLVVPVMVRCRHCIGSWRRANAALPYLGIAGCYGLYRFAAPSLFGFVDAKTELFGASTSDMLHKFRRMFEVNYYDAWAYSLQRIRELDWQGLLIVGAALMVAALAWWGAQSDDRRSRRTLAELSCKPILSQLSSRVAMLCVGISLMVLGYLPIVPTAYHILVGSIDSRVSIAASLGASLSIVSLLDILWLALHDILKKRAIACVLTSIVFTTLLGIASAQQYVVRQDYARAWNLQCSIWRQLFAIAPGFDANAYVLIAGVPHWQGATRILASPWEVGAALQLLYDNPTVRGDVLPLDELPASTGEAAPWHIAFSDDYFIPRGSDTPLPYDRLVLLEYNDSQQLEILASVPYWAPSDLIELRTHPGLIERPGVNPKVRRVVQSPFRLPRDGNY